MEQEDPDKETQTPEQAPGSKAQAPQACEAPPAPEAQAPPAAEEPAQEPAEASPCEPAPAAPAPPAVPEGLAIEAVKPGDLLKNLKDGHIYKVTGISGRKIAVRDLMAADRTFLFLSQFERPSDEDAVEFEVKRVKPLEPKESTVKPELARKETDAFAAYMEKVRQTPGSDAEKFESFWKQALEVFGDDPTQTWRMRVNKGLQPSPTLRLRSSKTNRWRDAVMLWAMEKLTIIVAKEVCPETDREACRGEFPDDNEAYGKAIAVTIPYRDLDEAKQKDYLERFRVIVKAFSA
ncbi:MAG: hypothetical protein HY748_02360 [Elusimicrobia bacterium]|nr:hypothetical protein [Elusimicrobiota bacterium]